MSTQPSIIISALDAERLEALLDSLPTRDFPGKAALEEELSRAEIVPPEKVPNTVVTMNSTVRFHVASSNEQFTKTLVYPRDMAEDGSTISILAPVGSALLGLSQGDTMAWPKPGGGSTEVTIDEITYQPERAGALHR